LTKDREKIRLIAHSRNRKNPKIEYEAKGFYSIINFHLKKKLAALFKEIAKHLFSVL